MKTLLKTLFTLSLFINAISSVQAQQDGKALFNADWQFHKGNSSFEEVMAQNQDWRDVSLPHDWSIEGPFSNEWASGTGFLPGGIGWYKKKFDIKNWNKDQNYFIYFDGIYKNSEVWINGHDLGMRPNGFIPIQYDLTPFLKPKNNILVVKADHTDFADSRFYTGSGIYRNVYLITKNQQYFSQWGVFFYTPKISENKANAQVAITYENVADQSKELQITAVLKNKKGAVVSKKVQNIEAKANATGQLQLDLPVDAPQLWELQNPYLYNLEVTMFSKGKLVDGWHDEVGIRDFKFTPDHGFFLNGKNMLLKGVCIHQDAGALGAAVPEEVWRSRLMTLKELGCNAIRMSHYPHQDYLYDLCDELGFLVQDEAFDEWEIGKNKWIEGWNVGKPGNDGYHSAFKKWGQKDVQDMIQRNRNHPSIIMWSIGNEIDYPNDPYSAPVLDEGKNPQIYGTGYKPDNPPASRLGEIAKELVASAKAVDTTRPITAALAGVTMSNHTTYPSELDIVGYNYQEYRYAEDHKAFPDRIIYGSENGDALDAWKAVEDNEFISSQFLWTAFDFIGEARKWPNRSSGAGIIDLAGYPKPDFYFRKSLWNEEPMVYIGITDSERYVQQRRNIAETWQGKSGELKYVTCYANTDEVELFLNGKSLGKQKAVYSTDKMIFWPVAYQVGELEVKGYTNGKEVARYVLNTPGPVDHLEVKTNAVTCNDSADDVVFVDIKLVDKNGNQITDQDQEISLDIAGAAKLLGLESGDLSSHESYQSNTRMTYQGRLKGYIELLKNGKGDDIKLSIKSKNLSEKILELKCENSKK